jgi:hypothetical protein
MSQTRWRRVVWALVLAATSASAQAQTATCSTAKTVPVTRQLRQLYLDLLNRPPTIAEYQAAQAKGSIAADDVRALMASDEFYSRMRLYHRALFKSNIAASVYDNGDTRLQGTLATGNPGDPGNPMALRGNTAASLRGGRNNACNLNVQQSQCNAVKEDAHAEPATKQCYDANGVPLPVSYDYDTINYVCTQLAATDCAAAVTAGLLPDKYLYYCDMRRDASNVLRPFRCSVNNTLPGQETLITEELDTNGRVVAMVDAATPTTRRLDRCTLTLALRNNLTGSYMAQRGCIQREGWETVPVPYYEPAASVRTTVQMCAIEAQDRAVNPGTLETCETGRFAGDRSCGCGAGSRRCEGLGAGVHNARLAAFNMEPELIADSVLRRDESYFKILTTRRSFVNGTLSQFYRQSQGTGVWTVSSPTTDRTMVPNVPYNDTTTWTEYARDDWHSGVLTSSEYLYRFATWRSRIASFYESMLCSHFAPPPNATLPAPDDTCNRENNLAQRCGCNYCHASIEPLASHWGRFGERGATFLDPNLFPRVDLRCRDCAINGDTFCGGTCTNYVMQAFDGDGANSLGLLKTYLYRTELEEENIAGGPQQLVEKMLATGDLERCTARRIWKEFLGRSMTQAEETAYLDQMVGAFVASGWNMKALIEWVVTSDLYRRID